MTIIICAIALAAIGTVIWNELAKIRQDIELLRANIQQYVSSSRTLMQLQIETLTLRKEELELRAAKRHIETELKIYNSRISPLRNDPS